LHKKLNVFEYEIDDKKIELTIIQISNLLDGILNDYEYLKYNIDFKCIYNEEDEDTIRNYNKGNKIVELFNTYYNKKRTKKSVYEQIGNELGIKWKSVQKTYLENK
jgi:hypothetical protein